MQPKKILRLPETVERTGLSRSSIYAKIKTGEFPVPVRLGPRSIGFLESSIDHWIDTRTSGVHTATAGPRK